MRHSFVRNCVILRSGNVNEKTFRAGEKVGKAQIDNQRMQYLYANGDDHVFMDNESYEQIELPGKQIEEELKFLKENMEVHVIQFKEEILGVELPVTVVLEVAETEPGIKGDTQVVVRNQLTLETGLIVQVPFFVNVGDKLIINTEESEYVSRA